jgi:hypothetical protein
MMVKRNSLGAFASYNLSDTSKILLCLVGLDLFTLILQIECKLYGTLLTLDIIANTAESVITVVSIPACAKLLASS